MTNAHPKLTVLNRTRSDRDTPNIVLANSPKNRSEIVLFRADPITIRQFDADKMNAKIGEYCGLVHGNIKENSCGTLTEGGTDGLLAAHALYRGIKRPKNQDGRDEKMLVYVTNPSCSYVYLNRTDGAPTPCPKPKDSVFVTYIDLFAEPEIDAKGREIMGLVKFWEWVIACTININMPDESEVRYTDKVW